MEGKHIQLPYGVFSDDQPKRLLHFNLPSNYSNYKRHFIQAVSVFKSCKNSDAE